MIPASEFYLRGIVCWPYIYFLQGTDYKLFRVFLKIFTSCKNKLADKPSLRNRTPKPAYSFKKQFAILSVAFLLGGELRVLAGPRVFRVVSFQREPQKIKTQIVSQEITLFRARYYPGTYCCRSFEVNDYTTRATDQTVSPRNRGSSPFLPYQRPCFHKWLLNYYTVVQYTFCMFVFSFWTVRC